MFPSSSPQSLITTTTTAQTSCLNTNAINDTPNAQTTKPTEFLFEGMDYFEEALSHESKQAIEQAKTCYTKAAVIFGRYINKASLIAEPYCLDLVKRGYLTHYNNPTVTYSLKGREEIEKTRRWYEASCEYKKLIHRDIKTVLQVAVKNKDKGPLLYIIGKIFELGTHTIKPNKDLAVQFFKQAFGQGSARAALGIYRTKLDQGQSITWTGENNIPKITAFKVATFISVMKKVGKDEAEIFEQLSTVFRNGKDSDTLMAGYFMKMAAQFGVEAAQEDITCALAKNNEEALFWAVQAAKYNNKCGLSICGHFFEQGKGTDQNYELAYLYLKKAAEHPQAEAGDYINLAIMYKDGKGTFQDYVEALFWYRKASKMNSSMCSSILEDIYKSAYILVLKGNWTLALQYLEILETAGNLDEGALYLYALALKENGKPEDALDKYWSLMQAGNIDLFNDIGACYDHMALKAGEENELGQKLELEKQALHYYQKQFVYQESNDHDNSNVLRKSKATASWNIARSYINKRANLYANNQKILNYLKIAADLKDSDALNYMGGTYYYGMHGISIDLRKAKQFFKDAVKAGSKEAKKNLVIFNLLNSSLKKNSQTINKAYASFYADNPAEAVALCSTCKNDS